MKIEKSIPNVKKLSPEETKEKLLKKLNQMTKFLGIELTKKIDVQLVENKITANIETKSGSKILGTVVVGENFDIMFEVPDANTFKDMILAAIEASLDEIFPKK